MQKLCKKCTKKRAKGGYVCKSLHTLLLAHPFDVGADSFTYNSLGLNMGLDPPIAWGSWLVAIERRWKTLRLRH